MAVIFFTGIDTGTGKTYATGLAARCLARRGQSVITRKLVQTGCQGPADDILTHRTLMGTIPNEDDRRGLTCSYLFPFPGSPHLAASLAGAAIDAGTLDRDTAELAGRYDHVLIEGAGGILTPLDPATTQLDYAAPRGYPFVVVSSPRLGSVNHTLLTLEAIRAAGGEVRCVVYNLYHLERPEIVADSRRLFADRLGRLGYRPNIIDIPPVDLDRIPEIDFPCLP